MNNIEENKKRENLKKKTDYVIIKYKISKKFKFNIEKIQKHEIKRCLVIIIT